jgi:hypothetical protein
VSRQRKSLERKCQEAGRTEAGRTEAGRTEAGRRFCRGLMWKPLITGSYQPRVSRQACRWSATFRRLNHAEKTRLKPVLQRLAVDAKCSEGHRACTSMKSRLKPVAKEKAVRVPPSGGL